MTRDDKKNKKVEEVEKVDEVEKKIEELENKHKRALADYQNLEKRIREERQEWIKSANKDLLLRLLPVLDTLILAQKHDQNKTLEVTIQQFLDTLKQEGIERIKTVGEKFDPTKMECIQIVKSQDEQDGKVIEETRAGFVLYDKVLRPAQVIVGGKQDPETSSG